MRFLAHSLSFSAVLAVCACSSVDDRPMITVKDTFFMEGKARYVFAGTNFWYGTYLAAAGEGGDRDRLVRELDALRDLGLTNLRVLGGSEQSYMKGMLSPAVQTAPGVYDERLLQGLDYLLAEMSRRDMRAVIFLTNYWEWSGGMAQYVTWSRHAEKGPDPGDPDFDWASFMDYSASFYSDTAAQDLYREYVSHLVGRRNTVTGRAYADDPTIMAWELANEPRPGSVSPKGERNLPAYNEWIESTAGYIRSLDPNHLVTTGSEGIIGSLVSADNFLAAHSTPSIDYLTVHVWPYNWQWFDPKDIDGTLDSATIKAIDYLVKHFGLARLLGKPLVLEEFGLARDSAFISPGSPVTARDRYFSDVLGMVYDSAAVGAPIAGANFWAWSGEGKGANEDGRWKAGDAFVGDPPHEPQGINSVFASDTSTVRILAGFASRMRALGSGTIAESGATRGGSRQ